MSRLYEWLRRLDRRLASAFAMAALFYLIVAVLTVAVLTAVLWIKG